MTDRTKITIVDITAIGETEGDSLVVDASGNVVASGVTGGGAALLDLTDTPDTYSGKAGLVATVNPGEDAIIFSGGGSSSFLDLTDSPSTFSGGAGKIATVNVGEDALEFTSIDTLATESNVFAYASGAQTGIADTTNTIVELDQVAWDFNNEWDTTADEFTATVSGYYQVNFAVRFNTWQTANGRILTKVLVNSTDAILFEEYATVGKFPSAGGAGMLNLNVDDVVELEVYQDSGYTQSLLAGQERTYLNIYKSALIASGGGGGGEAATPDFTTWSPYPEPSSPSSYDDEFDDSSFATGTWTEFDQDGELTITEDARGLVLTNTGSTFDITGAYQTAPTWGSSDGDGYTIYTRVAGVGLAMTGGGNNHAGIAFWEGTTSTSDIDIFGLYWGAAGAGIRASYFTDYDTKSTDFVNPTIYSMPEPTFLWLRVRCIAVDFLGIAYYYYFDISNDGISWMQIAQRERDFAPAQVGLFFASDYSSFSGNDKPSAIFPMFRVDTSNVYITDAVIPGGSRVNGYLAT